MTDELKVEREGHILHARFNRPAKKNAMTDAMYRGLSDAYREAEEDKDIRVLLLSGEGDSFTAGNDLSSFAAVLTLDQADAEDPPVLSLIERGLKATVPIVAAVEGWCVGIGATMMLHTDFIYAGEDAKFHMPFTQLGAVPEAGASRLLTRRLGRQRAAEMMLLSEVISAEKAHRYGFITDVVENGSAIAAAERTAERLAQLPPRAMRDTKKLMQEDLGDIIPHTRHELEVFASRLRSEEMQAIIAARMKG